MKDSIPKTEIHINRYDAEHLKKISSYLRMIDEAYRVATNEMARLVISSEAEYDPEKVFSFKQYPSVRMRVDRVASKLSSKIEMVIVNGIKAQWNLSNRKNNELVETVTGHTAEEFPDELRKRYFATNENVRDAFIKQTNKE